MKKAEPVQIVAVPSQPDDAHPVVDHVVEDDFASGEECMLFATEHADDDSLGHFILGGGDQPRHFEVKFHRGPRFVQREAARYVTMQKGHGQYQRFIPGAETTGFKVPTWYGLAIADVTEVRVWNLYLFSTEGDRNTALVLARTALSACVVLGVSNHEASDNVVFYGGDDEETRRFFTHLSVEGFKFEREGLYERPWATGKVQLHHTGPYRLVVPGSRSERTDDIDEVSQEMDRMAARILDRCSSPRPAEPDVDHATTEVEQERFIPLIKGPNNEKTRALDFMSVSFCHESWKWARSWTSTCRRVGAPLMVDGTQCTEPVWSSRWTREQVKSWPFWEVWKNNAVDVFAAESAEWFTEEWLEARVAKTKQGASPTSGVVRFMRPLVLVGQGPDGVIEYEQRNQCHFDRFSDREQWVVQVASSGDLIGPRPWQEVRWTTSLSNFGPGERWRLRVWSSRDQDDQAIIDDDSTRVEPVVEEAFVLPTEPGWYWAKTIGPEDKELFDIVQLRSNSWTESGDDMNWSQKKYADRARQLGLTFERIPYPGEE